MYTGQFLFWILFYKIGKTWKTADNQINYRHRRISFLRYICVNRLSRYFVADYKSGNTWDYILYWSCKFCWIKLWFRLGFDIGLFQHKVFLSILQNENWWLLWFLWCVVPVWKIYYLATGYCQRKYTNWYSWNNFTWTFQHYHLYCKIRFFSLFTFWVLNF